MSFATAHFSWQQGERRLDAQPPERRALAERIVTALVDQLRRRLGGPFTTDELVELYEREGTSWCLQTAMAIAPEDEWAWDSALVGDCAFARYLREARDFAGGRRAGAPS